MGITSRALLAVAIVIVAAGSTLLDREFRREAGVARPEAPALTDLSILADAPPSATTTYRVRRGDTLQSIARRIYGSPEHARLILTEGHVRAGRLREGQMLLLPGLEPPPVRVKTYLVQEGDSLFIISEKILGDGNLWRRIFDSNRDKLKSPTALRKGQVLLIREEL